jgi:hypothetical protein
MNPAAVCRERGSGFFDAVYALCPASVITPNPAIRYQFETGTARPKIVTDSF